MDNSSKDNKSQVIAEIDVNVHISGLPARNWQQETLDEHLNCILCGGHLEFKHAVDHINQTVNEEAKCPSCHIRNHATDHKLQ